ncbi:ankyrin repeat family A protein 2-like isoform X2 [Haliotis cracherodii]|uniref:ankyrin repeat family A protein 2-like isoform X2 n=2 Tax=Haliotis TaxID=6452 RepID=UPI0039EC83CC
MSRGFMLLIPRLKMESDIASTSKVQECTEKKQEKPSPERSWRVISPLKRLPSQPGNMRLFSPVDSDQELNDLEVENAFGDGVEPDSSQSLLSPTKARRYETPGKLNLSPFRPSTVMTNLHRGNVQTMTPSIVEHMSIHQMAAQGELVMLQQEIQEGSDINKLDEQGLTALHWACANGQMPTMEFLVQSGADINLSGNHGENALLLSSCYGYKEIVKYLLQLGMDVNCTDESGSTALMYAAYNNHPTCITALLEFGADITATNEDMLTAFDLTIGQDHKLGLCSSIHLSCQLNTP